MTADIIIASDRSHADSQSGGGEYKVRLVMVNRNSHGESDAFWGIMIIRMIRYQVSGRRGYPRSRCVSQPYLGFGGR